MTIYPGQAMQGLQKRYSILGDIVKDEIAVQHDGCRLCWALSETGQRYPVNSILYNTETYALIPALGALVPRYVMLVAKDHCNSAATLPSGKLEILGQHLDDVIALLKRKFPSSEWVVFEHGTTLQCGVKACCVDHLHLHLVPIGMDLAAELSRRLQCEPRHLGSLTELEQLNGETANYIYLRNPDNKSYVFTPESYSSQLVRQVIATRVGRENTWNWMHHPMEESTVQTLRDFRRVGIAAPTIYFAHAIEGILKPELPKTIQAVREALGQRLPGVQMLSMHELLEGVLEGTEMTDAEVNHFLVATEKQFVESCDLVLVDLSLPGWQYVGSLMEIVYASLAQIPIVAVVGDSKIGSRRWLNAHVTQCVKTLDEAVEVCAKLLSPSL